MVIFVVALSESMTVSESAEGNILEPMNPAFTVAVAEGNGVVKNSKGTGAVQTIKGRASNIGYEGN